MTEDQERSEEMRQVAEAIASGQVVVHYAKCWPCQVYPRQCYDPPQAHTWMDEDDAAHAGVTLPVDPNEAGRLCGCDCAKVSGGTPEPTDG